MPSADRVTEIEWRIDQMFNEQAAADKQYRADLEAARKAGRGQGFRDKTRSHIAGCNDRGRELQDLEDELSGP